MTGYLNNVGIIRVPQQIKAASGSETPRVRSKRQSSSPIVYLLLMVRFDVSPCPVLRLALPLHSILLCRLISVECGLYNGGGEGRGRGGHRTEGAKTHTRGTNAFLLSF